MFVKRIGNHSLGVPRRQTKGSAAFDLAAAASGWVESGGGVSIVSTGWAWEIPSCWCGLVLPRSSLAAKHGVTVANAPGLIDSDYRGEIGVALINHSDTTFHWGAGDRIAQLLIVPAFQGKDIRLCEEVDNLSSTDRGAGGFGSTGRG